MNYTYRFYLRHPLRSSIVATYDLDDTGTIYIEVCIIDSPLFCITVTASTDVELYEGLGLLVDTGFFPRSALLLAFRWSQWFSSHQIHDADVRRAAEVIHNLRHITIFRKWSLEDDVKQRLQHARQRAAE